MAARIIVFIPDIVLGMPAALTEGQNIVEWSQPMDPTTFDLLLDDAQRHGVAFEQDGKRIPIDEVLMIGPPKHVRAPLASIDRDPRQNFPGDPARDRRARQRQNRRR